jgi:hypothetical protein
MLVLMLKDHTLDDSRAVEACGSYLGISLLRMQLPVLAQA